MRSALDELGLAYTYVDIHSDEAGRQRVRQINHGCESVPTLVFPDGSTLTEPSLSMLRLKLDPFEGVETPPLAVARRRSWRQAAQVLVWAGGLILLGGFALDWPWLMLAGTLLCVFSAWSYL